jgi:hypothetical protein
MRQCVRARRSLCVWLVHVRRFVSVANIFKSPQRNWWDFLLETLHSIANKIKAEQSKLSSPALCF